MGLELEARAGLGFCIEQDEACEMDMGLAKPGFGGGLFTGLRLTGHFSLGLDFGYFTFRDELGDDSDFNYLNRLMNIMLEIRGNAPFGYKNPEFGDVYFKLGMGYLSYKKMAEMPGVTSYSRLYSPLNFKFGLGATFFFVRNSRQGDIGAGIGLDYLFVYAKRYESCSSDSQGEECVEHEFEEFQFPIHSVQLSAHLSWVIPVF